MGLVNHAESELRRAGLFDQDSDYGGMLGPAVMELVRVFAAQGHSGFSSGYALRLFNTVAQWRELTPLTSNPAEWNDVSKTMGKPSWQNKRNPAAFSEDGGKTWKVQGEEERR